MIARELIQIERGRATLTVRKFTGKKVKLATGRKVVVRELVCRKAPGLDPHCFAILVVGGRREALQFDSPWVRKEFAHLRKRIEAELEIHDPSA